MRFKPYISMHVHFFFTAYDMSEFTTRKFTLHGSMSNFFSKSQFGVKYRYIYTIQVFDYIHVHKLAEQFD